MIKINELTQKQQAFLKAMLTTQSVTEAYKQAGIAKRTAQKYLDDPIFKEELHKQKIKIMDMLTLRLQTASTEAVDTILEIMNNEETSEATRLNGAKTIIYNAYKGYEIEELNKRMDEIEARLKDL